MITRNVTLWFGSSPRVTIPVSQYDDMWQFVFSIVNDSVPWSIPDSAQVTLNGLKPDGNVFAYYGTVSGGKATVDCDIQMTAVAGLVECELSILDASKVVGTANFFLSVEQAPKADDAVMSESTLAAYGEVLDQISQYAAGFIPVGVKTALLNCFSHVAWIDEHGQDYYDALATALAQKTLVSISAVYTQSGTVYTDDSLDSLKSDLVVTATYDDASTATVPSSAYTLSGTLTVGTSTITVTYDGKTTTFTVTVTAPLYSIPDFVEQTGTASGTYAVSKTNGYYSVSGTFSGVVYISPGGVVSTNRTTTTWFAIPNGASVATEIKDITWSNPGGSEVQLQAKMQRSDATGNLFQASFAMAANSSGTNGNADATNVAGGVRNMSGVVFQALTSGGGSRNFSVSATFKVRIFVDGVRYL